MRRQLGLHGLSVCSLPQHLGAREPPLLPFCIGQMHRKATGCTIGPYHDRQVYIVQEYDFGLQLLKTIPQLLDKIFLPTKILAKLYCASA